MTGSAEVGFFWAMMFEDGIAVDFVVVLADDEVRIVVNADVTEVDVCADVAVMIFDCQLCLCLADE